MIKTKTFPTFYLLLIPILADLLGIGIHRLLAPTLAQQFARPGEMLDSLGNLFFFGIFYLFFLIGVYLIQTMETINTLPQWLQSSSWRAFLAAPMVITVLGVIGDITGFFRTARTANFGDTGTPYYFLLSPAIFVFIGLLYLFMLSLQTDEPRSPSKTMLPALLSINLFLGALASYLHTNLSLSFSSTFILLLILFFLPRLLYSQKLAQPIALISLIVSFFYYAMG